MSSENRCTAAEALELPYLECHHNPLLETIYTPGPIVIDANETSDVEQWRRIIFEEIFLFRQANAPLVMPEPQATALQEADEEEGVRHANV